MQNSRCVLWGCVAAVALLPLGMRADDTAAQAKARRALEEQLHGSPAKPATNGPAPAANAPQQAKPAAAPAATAQTNSLENTLNQSISEMKPPPPPPGQPWMAGNVGGSQEDSEWSIVAPPAVDSADIAKAREAMRQKIQDLRGGPEAAAMLAPPPTNMSPHDTAVYMAVQKAKMRDREQSQQQQLASQAAPPVLQPLAGPAPPITAVQQQKLQVLLQKYMADQISPEQYHEERAKILGQP
jgi:hypothetical protein